MEKITAKIVYAACLLLCLSDYLCSQEVPQTDLTFFIRLEDDTSDAISQLPSYFDFDYVPAAAFPRYEDSVYRFEHIRLGADRDATADTPDFLSDVFDEVPSRFALVRDSGKNSVHGRFESSFYFHHRHAYYASHWSVFSEKFTNDFVFDMYTDGYKAVDALNVTLSPALAFFNVFWSYGDTRQLTVNDAAGVHWAYKDIRLTYSGYGGYDILGMSALLGTFFSVRFACFDTGGYIGLRHNMFNAGTKFAFFKNFASVSAAVDLKTDFVGRLRFTPDFAAEFSFRSVTFGVFKQTDLFYSDLFVRMSDMIHDFRYTKDTKTVAGVYADTSAGRISVNSAAVFYDTAGAFLSLDESLSFLPPRLFSQCIVSSAFRRFALHFAGYLDFDFAPNVSVGTGVGVKEISVPYVLLGFFADFVAENTFADYRLTIRTEIATDVSRYYAFFLRTYQNFYCNKPVFDFYLQCGFKGIF